MPLFRRRTLWIWPVLAALILAIAGWSIRGVVESAAKSTMEANLQAILNADVTALKIWLQQQESNAATVASDERVAELVSQLIALGRADESGSLILLQSKPLAELRQVLKPWLQAHGYDGFAVATREGRLIAAQRDGMVGRDDIPIPEGLLDTVFAGNTTVTRPFPSAIVMVDESGQGKAGLPTMFAAAPVRDQQRQVVAVFGLRIRPDVDFTRILSVARAGKSGEAYAFDKNGVLISQSRFDDQLKLIGLLPDRNDIQSLLNIQIRDPGVDMAKGRNPKKRRSSQPLTRMAADATKGKPGVDVDGYRDYRGVPVVGAWTWLPEYGFGVAAEVDVAEAFRPLYILRYTFGTLFGLIAAGALVIFAFTVFVARLNRAARKAALEAKQLGQYSLDEKIGAGGMGVVYRGHHAMLRRATAIKLLDVDKTTEDAIARFEREVQLTSQLNHPNTIAIYDYGRTPEGLFYYAMEYLDGITLDRLVDQNGPVPESRVIYILQQVCSSLAEAHGVGLIHRDIKPENVMINRRGGMFDVVKILDFGLVKAVDANRQSTLTAAGALTGTPMYISPEGIEDPDAVDARSDLYAVGAIGYFLLTGNTVFEGKSVVEICMQHIKQQPIAPSERLEGPVDDDLEALLLKCLAKDPSDRPQSAGALQTELQQCQSAGTWSQADAEGWWLAVTGEGKTEPTKTSMDTSAPAATLILDRPQVSKDV